MLYEEIKNVEVDETHPFRHIGKIEIGSSDQVIIEKMYGPTIFADIKIEADCDRGWVIYRRWVDTGEWIEWCVIPAQLDQEFKESDEINN